MKILFVHQNFPGQYLHLARHLAHDATHEVVAITQRKDVKLHGVKTLVYAPPRKVTQHMHPYLADTEAGVLNGQQVARIALQLRDSGFTPDIMVGHNGWGEIWFLKDVFPAVPLLGYFEFFYRSSGSDVGFDPATPSSFDDGPRLRVRNTGNLIGLEAADAGQCPTQWQKRQFPRHFQPILHEVHEGIDTRVAAPDPAAFVRLAKAGVELRAGDEVVTYVARNLERYRGFPSFMRALPAILSRRPKAHVLIVGGDETSYGPRRASDTPTLRQQMLAELGGSLDTSRVHFVGKLPHSAFIKILQVSMAHVYLTYPFVLSWSMLEALSAGCLVVGSRTQPVEEVIRDGENGVLADFFSPADIASKVIAALEHPREHAAIRSRARQSILQRYDLASICLPAQLALLERIRS
jgi:glycosyltransferase involved in cell wall biosynthesis